jgi:pimeloyl-ACP methyl ester carboxylesterase
VGSFPFVSADGTRVTGWRNDAPEGAVPVVVSNGLGTPPAAWPTLVRPDSGFRVATFYYRGTGGGERPADPTRIRVEDHVADLLALMDHEGIDRALLACWSLGVNVGFELYREHPERVAGIMAVAGVPGGTFRAMFGPLRLPRRFRHDVGVAAARLGRRLGPQLSWLSRHVPLTRATAAVISHSGFVLPAATPDRLIPALREFREHDFRWYFDLAVAAAEHDPMDLAFVDVPVTLVAGRYDVLTSMHDVTEAASRIPHAELRVLPGSHFLPLEYPDELVAQLRRLATRAGWDAASAATQQPSPES